MENSPKLRIKKPNRLSIGKRSGRNESPKTPVRVVDSPEFFNTPPSFRSLDSPNSTPVNRMKRTCFAEESPSQDYSTTPTPIIFSQECEHFIDVDWKWDDDNCNTEIPIKKLIKSSNIKRLKPQKKNKVQKSSENDQKKGFYKFREQLMHNLATNLSDGDHESGKDLELDSSLKENVAIPDKDHIKEPTPSLLGRPLLTITDTMKETPSGMLDDSDLDNLLLQCSQQAEAHYEQSLKKQTKNDAIELDSIDEMLLSLPSDEKDLLCLQNNLNSSTRETSGRSSFSRHNSMPTYSPKCNTTISNSANFLVRYNSMPPNQEQNKESKISRSSSSEFGDSQKKCTASEIKRKRLEAIQRREANKQKKIITNMKLGVTNKVQKGEKM